MNTETTNHTALGRFGRFACSSLVSTGIDQLLAWTLFAVLRDHFPGADFVRILLASIVARVASVAVNYSINRRVVFGEAGAGGNSESEYAAQTSGSSDALHRFVLLSAAILCFSSMGVWAAHVALGMPEWQAKPLVDLALFFLNYTGQRKWVFAQERLEERPALA